MPNQKKCTYTTGNGGKRMDCINALFKKLRRPICNVCKPRINIVPRSKHVADPETPTVVSTNTEPESTEILNITQEI